MGQFVTLHDTMDDYGMDFVLEIQANSTAVFLNFPFWRQHDFTPEGIDRHRRDEVLAEINRIWEIHYPELPLPEQTA